ncbi:MAG: aspartate/glutamate racemase family protein, partial [Aeromonas sobria]
HIADATAAKLRADGVTRVGLLGTRFTMEQDFYKGRLQERFGLAVLVPDEAGRERVHRIIYDELCLGEIRESSRAEYLAIIAGLAAAGAEAVILGCTEIALLVGDARAAVPLYDTTAIHAEAAVALALSLD